MQQQAVTGVRYRIVVRGSVGERFAALFAGLDCQTRAGESVLTGEFDQARLHGLLDRLRDLGIHIVSVNPADTSNGKETP